MILLLFYAFAAIVTGGTTSDFANLHASEAQEVALQVDNFTSPKRHLQSPPPLEVRVAGTLSYNVPVHSQQVFRGFEIIEEAVNATGYFQGRRPPLFTQDGRQVKVKFTFQDDGGYPSLVSYLYEKMINESAADYYVAPYGATATEAAANLTQSRDAFLVSHNAMYTPVDQPYVFTTQATDANSMDSTLDLLKAKGATSVIFAWQDMPDFSSVCMGAWAHANETEWITRYTFLLDAVSLARDIRESGNYEPDVFVCCSDYKTAVRTMVVARAMDLQPKALVFTQASNPEFLRVMTPTNANYLMAPTHWYANADGEDFIFGSRREFQLAYQSKYSIDPEVVSASAAAAGMAIVLAVRNLGKIGTSQEMRDAFLEMDAPTFYRQLNFSINGTLSSQRSQTMQVMPNNSYDALSAWLTSIRTIVGHRQPGVEEPRYPMPMWDVKEASIYPCPVGQTFNQSDMPYNLTCIPCPPGRFRTHMMLDCAPCPPGTHNTQEGQGSCKLCPQGANCDAGGVVRAVSRQGWYRVSMGVYHPCNPPELCAGSNQCAGNHEGMMCANCKEDYTVHGLLAASQWKCAKCVHWGINLTMISCMVLVWFAVSVSIGILTVRSSVSIKSMHSIILKKAAKFDSPWFEWQGVPLCGRPRSSGHERSVGGEGKAQKVL